MSHQLQSVGPFELLEEEPEQAVAASTTRVPPPEEANAVALEASAVVYQNLPWIGALLEAALLCSAEERRPLQFQTNWGGNAAASEELNDEKHEAYVTHFRTTVQSVYPWLLPLLDSARVTLLVSPGMCCFTVQSRLGFVFDIPQLIPLTHLTPFAPENGDVIH